MKVKCIKSTDYGEITIGNTYECLGFGTTDLDYFMLSIIDDEGDISYTGEENGYLYDMDMFEIIEDPDGKLTKRYEEWEVIKNARA